ncbi:DUF3750 domain-containing protein [Aidingimonas halophila]|uniref:DUF3750 domain-containing protein n=1 Tax=Aidingimonas halophila TaxID=574349 RepID=A0A1H2VVR6_9GAMM|nr:DUF3750 domain-containing protein [Aidingimonas halophila]GHC24867.1 hypothetical protein GCM10008094_15060 [Aidingimonas halophila]SDW72448.1 Protein of unknown function [Aidingimonas halophila]
MKRLAKVAVAALLSLILLLSGPLLMLASSQVTLDHHWSSADRSSAGLAPAADQVQEAVVQVYSARAYHWRGAFGVHTWIATKEEGANHYRIYQVLSWRRPTVVINTGVPDRAWYGSIPELLADYRGQSAQALIPQIDAAVDYYPASQQYRAWPGPNSNSFVAWVIRNVSGLEVALPNTAIGKDFLFDERIAPTTGGHGVQLSLSGVLGIAVGLDAGVEFNLLGLSVGIDVRYPAFKLPGIGRLGMERPVAGDIY